MATRDARASGRGYEGLVMTKPLLLRFVPESIDAMRARFDAAIAELLINPGDPRQGNRAHTFDFEDEYRLLICRDSPYPGKEVICVSGGFFDLRPFPVTLLICRVGINFALISEHKYGDGKVVYMEPGFVMMTYALP